MNEWSVVGVLIVLAGLVGGVAKPMLALNGAIVRLTTLLESITATVAAFTQQNNDCHDKLWAYSYKQDEQLTDHESRITVLEVKEKKG